MSDGQFSLHYNQELTNDSQLSIDAPKVAILLATYNGEAYLQEQLDSFASQTQSNWILWASDDGSTDKTIAILQKFAERFPIGKVNIISGPKTGFADNFLSLIHNSQVSAQNYAYADQDDTWLSDKLERALTFLEKIPVVTPALYCSRTNYVDENLKSMGVSVDQKRPASFSNALVQNIASGNTMVFNQATRSLLASAGKELKISLHDWWTYLAVTACGGEVFFDKTPSLLYRQHANNVWGKNTGWINRYARIKKLFEGRFRSWNKEHLVALAALNGKVTMNNQEVLSAFIQIRDGNLPRRLFYLSKSGLYRQKLLGNLGLWVGAIFHKI
jgi:glycosyltransferase involved in cell wall biosynthesis